MNTTTTCELSNIMSLARNNFVYASTTRGS